MYVTLNQQVPFCTTMLLDNKWTVMVVVSSFPSLPLLDSKTHDCDVHALCVHEYTLASLRSDGSFQRRRYSNEDFTVTLPDGMDLCDIGTLTIWCRPFRAIFTRIEIPRNIFVSSVMSQIRSLFYL